MVELLVVLVLVAVLIVATLRNDGGPRVKESELGNGAVMELKIIFNAENAYRLDKGVYTAAPTATQINALLGVGVQNPRFNYAVAVTPAGFTATATRTDGTLCRGRSITINQNGTVAKGCTAWP